MPWFWSTISLILFLWVTKQLMTLNKKRKLPPGPIGLPILGHFHLFGNNPHQDFDRLARKYGPIMWLRLGSVPTLVISSPAAAENVLKNHDLNFSSKPGQQAAELVSYGRRNLVFSPYGPYWRNMRKLCTLQLLSSHKINQFQPMRRAELQILVGSLKQAAERRETVDLSSKISGLIGDMNCLMVFGRKYEDRDLDEKGFKAVIEETLCEAGTFNIGDYFPYLRSLDLQGLNRRMKNLSKTFDGFLERIIDDHVRNRKNGSDGHDDFVDTMMALMESGEAGFEFDRRHVKAVLLDMLIAGMDSSATTIDWTLSELIKNPRVMKKLQMELEGIFGKEKMEDIDRDIEKLEYLNSVLYESFRLHPAAPIFFRETIDDCTLDGFHVPKETVVVVNAWSIGRDPNVWKDPEKFIPERFIGKNVDVKGRDFRLIPFGSGRRGCPGTQLALALVRMVVAQLVHCFDWELPDGTSPSDLDMTEHFGMVTRRATHVMATPIYRLLQ